MAFRASHIGSNLDLASRIRLARTNKIRSKEIPFILFQKIERDEKIFSEWNQATANSVEKVVESSRRKENQVAYFKNFLDSIEKKSQCDILKEERFWSLIGLLPKLIKRSESLLMKVSLTTIGDLEKSEIMRNTIRMHANLSILGAIWMPRTKNHLF